MAILACAITEALVKFQRQLKKEDVSVNLTPLIDVVFLLLIFFMVTTTFSQNRQLSLTLPDADGQARTADDDTIELSIQPDGVISLAGQTFSATQPSALRTALQALAGEGSRPALLISADADASHQSVVTAMDIAGQLGFTRIHIATRHTEQDE